MSTTKDRFNLYMQPTFREEVRRAAQQNDESMAQYIRTATRERLSREGHSKRLPPWMQSPTS